MSLPGIVDVVIPFVLLLGVLIFIHELGHFAVAKWLGVKVEKFSIGFGPSLLARKIGETEYVIAALPLGGFVKMLGEVPGEALPAEDAARAFNMRPVWQRIAIALAGPVMNLLLPILLLAALLMSGLPTATSRIGDVLADSAAERAGLRPGDRVVAVGGEELWRFEDLAKQLGAEGPAKLELVIERDGARQTVTVERERGDKGPWQPIGIDASTISTVLVVPEATSPLAESGVRTGDRVVAVNGTAISNLFELREQLAAAKGPLELEVERALPETERVIARVRGVLGATTLEALGGASLDFAVLDVTPTSPAKQAGIRRGDVVLSVGGAPVTSRAEVVKAIRASGGAPVRVELLRAGQPVALELTPRELPTQTETGVETHWAIGISLGPIHDAPEMRDDVVRNPLTALWRGTVWTGDILAMIVGGIAQLVTGSVGVGSLSGPIGIGEIAAEAFSVSWTYFVHLMAVISVNLAILNLLPIPVLDGGQIVLAAAEGVKGSPLPARAREVAQTVGLSLILLLMGVAFWNDIARHWSGILAFVTNLG